MNTSDPAVNISSPFTTESLPWNLSSLSTTIPPSLLPSEPHNPLLTIMVVLGLFLLLAGCAAFLAVCRPSGQEGGSDGSCNPGEALACGPSLSSEPQLKLWKRLGSVRCSFTSSFRRPPQRRPDHDRTHCSPPRPQSENSPSPPHLTMPCLFDYVTEI